MISGDYTLYFWTAVWRLPDIREIVLRRMDSQWTAVGVGRPLDVDDDCDVPGDDDDVGFEFILLRFA